MARARLAARVGLAVATTLLALATVEGALRIASGVYAEGLRSSRRQSIDAGRIRLLCVGDSNTFGVRVAAADSYPGQLERLMNQAGPRYQLVNRGIPGQNTAQILANLDDELLAAQPAFLLVLAGVNNGWNAAGRDERRSPLDHLRLVRWIRLAIHDVRSGSRTDAPPEVAAVQRNRTARSADELTALTRDDLMRIVAKARAASATPILMTYPGQHPGMTPASNGARAAARDSGALLIDLDQSFAGYVSEYGFDALAFEDSHLAEAGYELMARDIVNALVDAGLVDLPRPDAGPPAHLRPPVELSLEHDEQGRPWRMHLRGEPGESFQVLISPLRGPPISLGPRVIPIGSHPWVELCKQAPELRGQLDQDGKASVPVPEAIRTASSSFFAAFVTDDPRAAHAISVRSISPAVEIRPAPPAR